MMDRKEILKCWR